MDNHKNARLTPKGREAMVRAVVHGGLSKAAAARKYNATPKTVGKWVERFRTEGVNGLHDRSSKPLSSPNQTPQATCAAVEALRRQRFSGKQIAAELAISPATVSRILYRLGLNRLSALEPAAPIRRYERKHPGELIRIDIKKLGKFNKIGHRIKGRSQRSQQPPRRRVGVCARLHRRSLPHRLCQDHARRESVVCDAHRDPSHIPSGSAKHLGTVGRAASEACPRIVLEEPAADLGIQQHLDLLALRIVGDAGEPNGGEIGLCVVDRLHQPLPAAELDEIAWFNADGQFPGRSYVRSVVLLRAARQYPGSGAIQAPLPEGRRRDRPTRPALLRTTAIALAAPRDTNGTPFHRHDLETTDFLVALQGHADLSLLEKPSQQQPFRRHHRRAETGDRSGLQSFRLRHDQVAPALP
jgi:transposase